MSRLLVLATLFSLLLCPYRCMGSLVVGIASAQDEQAVSCLCCRTRHTADSPTGEGAPDESGDECCSNCLCKGAILNEDDGFLASAADAPDFAILPGDISGFGPFIAVPELIRHRGDSPPRDSRPAGRHLLFAVQSLLL